MPDSMTMEETGVILKEMGRRMDMAAPAPIPGRTPMRVPSVTPIRQLRRVSGVKMTEKPKARWPKTSMAGVL
jgi:hypothetical protein